MDRIAFDTADYWSENCTDDDFYKNCLESICNELQDTIHCRNNNKSNHVVCNNVYGIWNIIENKYLNL